MKKSLSLLAILSVALSMTNLGALAAGDTEHAPLLCSDVAKIRERALQCVKCHLSTGNHVSKLWRHGYVRKPDFDVRGTVYTCTEKYLNVWKAFYPIYINTSTPDTVTCFLPSWGFKVFRNYMLSDLKKLANRLKTDYDITSETDMYGEANCNDVYCQLSLLPKERIVSNPTAVEFLTQYRLYRELDKLYDPSIEQKMHDPFFFIMEEKNTTTPGSIFHVKLTYPTAK